MLDTYSQTINVPKKDLLSIVAEVKPGALNGCKFCRKTILWNGGTWVHVNDKANCDGVHCFPEWTKETEGIEELHGFLFLRKRIVQAPISRCQRCNKLETAYSFNGKWHTSMGVFDSCKAAVATPIGEGAK